MLIEELPEKPLTNDQVSIFLNSHSKDSFRGVYMCDELPTISSLLSGVGNKIAKIVVNLDSSESPRNGTHWVGLILLKTYKYGRVKYVAFYFDPYGLPPSISIQRHLKNFEVFFNILGLQTIKNPDCFHCGHLVCLFLALKWPSALPCMEIQLI